MNYLEIHQLKEIRESTGLGVRLFSRTSNLSPSTVQKIESEGNVSRDNYEKYLSSLASLLNKDYSLIIKPKKTAYKE